MAIFNTRYTAITGETETKKWSPNMTADNAPAPFVANSSTPYRSNSTGEVYSAYKAFDGDLSKTWYSAATNRWLTFDHGSPIEVLGVDMLPSKSFAPEFFPKVVTISGSNDGGNWTEIITDNGGGYILSADSWRTIMFDDAVSYRHFKFDFGLAYNNYAQSIVCEIFFVLKRR